MSGTIDPIRTHSSGAPLPRVVAALLHPPRMPEGVALYDFRRALEQADVALLQYLGDDRVAITQIGDLVAAHGTVERLLLVTSRTRSGRTGKSWAPLVRAFLATRGTTGCEVVADDAHVVDLDTEEDVLRRTHRVVADLLAREEDLRLDVSGGTRAMRLGALWACFAAGRGADLLMADYDDLGAPLRQHGRPIEVRAPLG